MSRTRLQKRLLNLQLNTTLQRMSTSMNTSKSKRGNMQQSEDERISRLRVRF